MRAVGDEREDLRDQALLYTGFLNKLVPAFCVKVRTYQLSVKLGEARLTGVIEDEDGINHGGWLLSGCSCNTRLVRCSVNCGDDK